MKRKTNARWATAILKRKTNARWVTAICAAALCCLPGCGSKHIIPTIQVKIFDCYTETRLAAQEGMTVGQALAEAEIFLQEGDEVTPPADARITEEGTEISVGRRARVTVDEGGKGKEFMLNGKKVKEAIAAAGIEVGKHDEVNQKLEAYLTDGMEIQVRHRYAVEINVDGRKIECLTEADTVRGMLEEQEIHLDEKDTISPSLETKLHNGTKVAIHRVHMEQATEHEPIPFETEIEYTASMYQGESARRRQGQEGEKELTYKVTYVDGKEESRELVGESVTREPVNEIIAKGTKERRRVVSREQIYDCDGSGHGYYIITWSDGAVEYQDF